MHLGVCCGPSSWHIGCSRISTRADLNHCTPDHTRVLNFDRDLNLEFQTQFGTHALLPSRNHFQLSHIDTPLTLNYLGNWFSAVPLTLSQRGQLQNKSWLRENPSWSWVVCLFFPVSLPHNTQASQPRLNNKGSGVLSTSC